MSPVDFMISAIMRPSWINGELSPESVLTLSCQNIEDYPHEKARIRSKLLIRRAHLVQRSGFGLLRSVRRATAWHNVMAVRVLRVRSNRVENLKGMIPS